MVHYTRLLFFFGDPIPKYLEVLTDGFPASILQAAWPAIRRFVELEQGIASAVARFETATYSISGLGSLLANADGEELIHRRMQLVHQTISAINAVVLDADAGEQFTRNYATLSGLDTIWDRYAHSAAKAMIEPMTQVFGMSPSGLSTDDESGRANWRKHVQAYQDRELRPALERYYTMVNGGKPVRIVFKEFNELTPQQEADMAVKKATARNIYGNLRLGNGPVLTDPRFTDVLIEDGLLPRKFSPAITEVNPDKEAMQPPPAPETGLPDDDEGSDPEDPTQISVDDPSGITNRTDGQRLDPYTGQDDPNLPDAVREMTAKQRAAWVQVFNSTLDDTDSEEKAFQAAYIAAKQAAKDTNEEK